MPILFLPNSRVVPPKLPTKPCKIAFVGEAPGKTEVESPNPEPFIGKAGELFRAALESNNISLDECLLTNVINQRPPFADNQFDSLLLPKSEVTTDYQTHLPKLKSQYPDFPWPPTYTWPKLGQGLYLPAELLHHLPRLHSELTTHNPNIVVPLGRVATWAVLQTEKIGAVRGRIHQGILTPHKVMPTWHPAGIFRQPKNYPTFIIDLQKIKLESNSSEIKIPDREFWLEPSIEDLESFWSMHQSTTISVDIETAGKFITCVGIAPSEKTSLVIPFVSKQSPDYSYWPTATKEKAAWDWITKILTDSAIHKILQNGLYDFQRLWFDMGIPIKNYSHDTMYLQHSLQPELPKSLDYLSSIYTNEPTWKHFSKFKSNKRED